jgi:FMN-dependent NADH-azoreductase
MNVLVINCSPKKTESSTYRVAKAMIKQLSGIKATKVKLLDATALPHIDSSYASSLCSSDDGFDSQQGSLALSDQLITSLVLANIVIIASPMHNYTLPSCLKSWIDHVVRAGKTFEITSTGKKPLLVDKPVYILVSAGGSFSGEAAYQPDFFTPYMTEVLATIGLNNPLFFAIEGTVSSKELLQQRIESVQRRVCEHLVATLI